MQLTQEGKIFSIFVFLFFFLHFRNLDSVLNLNFFKEKMTLIAEVFSK